MSEAGLRAGQDGLQLLNAPADSQTVKTKGTDDVNAARMPLQTYTMLGELPEAGQVALQDQPPAAGLIPRILAHLFSQISQLQQEQRVGREVTFSVSCALLEIYKEQARGLAGWAGGGGPHGSCKPGRRWARSVPCLHSHVIWWCSDWLLACTLLTSQITDLVSGADKITLREDPRQGVFVDGLSWHAVDSGEGAWAAGRRAVADRHVGGLKGADEQVACCLA